MLAAAKTGDTAAARLVLSYAVGPPLSAADPDRLDANELEALRSRPNMLDLLALDPLTPEPMVAPLRRRRPGPPSLLRGATD